MTISTEASQITLQGNGVTTVFAVNFTADSSSDIAVIYTNASGQQTTLLPTQYLVAIPNPLTGEIWANSFTITYPLFGSPIAAGTSLTVQRILPYQQLTDLQNQGNFYAVAVEAGLDELEMQIQQTAARTGSIRGTWLTDTSYNFGDIVVDGVNGNDTGNLYSCAIPNISGTWSTDLANGLWSLALNIQGIVNSLPQIGNNQAFANISGMTATPTGVGVSALIDSALGNTQGSILYRSGSAWTVLAPGTNGQVLQTQGVSANPLWVSGGGGGTITSVTAGTGLSGGGSGGGVTLSLANIADQAMLANTSGTTNAPAATTLSAFLDEVLGSTQGSIIYRGATVWQELTPGSSGQFLQTQGASSNPEWADVAATGALLIANNLSDVASIATSLTNLGFAKSLVSNGSATIGLNGMILKVGQSTTGGGGTVGVSFTTPFPNSLLGVFAFGTVPGISFSYSSTSTSGFTLSSWNSQNGFLDPSRTAYWFTVGN